jgi:hypothetical protein
MLGFGVLLAAWAVAALEPAVPPSASHHAGTPAVVGYLEGTVTIGPRRPAQRADTPAAPAPADVYAAHPITILAADGATWVADVPVRADGTYRVALVPGTYVVTVAAPAGRRRRGTPPTRITITGRQTVRLDIAIDTGMR